MIYLVLALILCIIQQPQAKSRGTRAAVSEHMLKVRAQKISLLRHNMSLSAMCQNPRGWNLWGSDPGCCGNYDECCSWATSMCWYHDVFCRCCDYGFVVCGPLCVPDPGCLEDESSGEITLETGSPDPNDLEETVTSKMDTVLNDSPFIKIVHSAMSVGTDVSKRVGGKANVWSNNATKADGKRNSDADVGGKRIEKPEIVTESVKINLTNLLKGKETTTIGTDDSTLGDTYNETKFDQHDTFTGDTTSYGKKSNISLNRTEQNNDTLVTAEHNGILRKRVNRTMETNITVDKPEEIQNVVNETATNNNIGNSLETFTVSGTGGNSSVNAKSNSVNDDVKSNSVNCSVNNNSINGTVDNSSVNGTVGSNSFNVTVENNSVNVTVGKDSVNDTVKNNSVEGFVERDSVNCTMGKDSVKDTLKSISVISTVENNSMNGTVGRNDSVNGTVENNSVNGAVKSISVNNTVENSPVNVTVGIESVNGTVKGISVNGTVENNLVNGTVANISVGDSMENDKIVNDTIVTLENTRTNNIGGKSTMENNVLANSTIEYYTAGNNTLENVKTFNNTE